MRGRRRRGITGGRSEAIALPFCLLHQSFIPSYEARLRLDSPPSFPPYLPPSPPSLFTYIARLPRRPCTARSTSSRSPDASTRGCAASSPGPSHASSRSGSSRKSSGAWLCVEGRSEAGERVLCVRCGGEEELQRMMRRRKTTAEAAPVRASKAGGGTGLSE